MHLAFALLTTCSRHLSNQNVANSMSIKHRTEITYGVNKSVYIETAARQKKQNPAR